MHFPRGAARADGVKTRHRHQKGPFYRLTRTNVLSSLDLLLKQLKPQPIFFCCRELGLGVCQLGSRNREGGAVAGIKIRVSEQLFEPADLFIKSGDAGG